MPQRLRDKHMREVIESMIRYAADGGVLRYQSGADEGDRLQIVFTFDDGPRYHTILNEVMGEDPEPSTA
jgi:hypothetical protein